jgi:2-polyprenyl-3-methyl-5-hydroxy-6-metoxy-1,4-benzoquinol methylase
MNSIDIAALCLGRRVLDIGCGRNKFPGAEGIDFAANSMADVRHDLNVFPYPLPDSRYEVILLRNVIEHLQDVVRLMEEVHRVGKAGADVIITTPHFSSLYSYQDPTHLRHLALDSMDYFTEDTKHSNFYSDLRFRIVGKGLDFGKSFPFSLVAKALFKLSARSYEKHFAFIFPANSLWFHLQALK